MLIETVDEPVKEEVLVDENGVKLSKNKKKKKKGKNVFKKMFIQGRAMFIDFRFLIENHLNFLGNNYI